MKMEVERKSKNILLRAVAFRASDIHFVPMEKHGIIRFRIDGQLVDMDILSVKLMTKVIGHLKFISGMDVGERRRPQNSSLEIPLLKESYSMRLSTFPSTLNETLVIRLFPHDTLQNIHQLAIFPNQANQLLNAIQASAGLFILCGPTGSGKTTTLYSILDTSFNLLKRNIITLEDPVEQKRGNFLQMEINESAGVTYAEGLRSLLRHDPDMIMIGEIRDSETAKMAVRAALTGHFVVTTLHSMDTLSALKRLYDLGIESSDLKDTLKAVVAQRLVDLVCPYCRVKCNSYCLKYRDRRRGAIFEVLSDASLNSALAGNENELSMKHQKLSHAVNKAVALGFVAEKEVFRMGKGGYLAEKNF